MKQAIKAPTSIDERKVEAQLARRILDRLVGFKVSPLLWKAIKTVMGDLLAKNNDSKPAEIQAAVDQLLEERTAAEYKAARNPPKGGK